MRGGFGHPPPQPREARDQPGEEWRLLPGALAPHLEVEPRAPLEQVPRHEGVASLVITVDAPRRDDPLSNRGEDEQRREQRDNQAGLHPSRTTGVADRTVIRDLVQSPERRRVIHDLASASRGP